MPVYYYSPNHVKLRVYEYLAIYAIVLIAYGLCCCFMLTIKYFDLTFASYKTADSW
ncbi:hypothetical protein ES708_34634 [subsurface metagenome]